MEFLAQFPVAMLFLAGCLGIIAHWAKRYFKAQTTMNLLQFFIHHKKAIAGSFVVLAGTLVGMVGAGLETLDWKTFALYFSAGFNLNSVFTSHDENEKA